MNKFAALGDPVRLRMVEQLAVQECNAGQLASAARQEFGVSQPAASRHLRVLREAGLVQARVEGTRRVYSLDRDGVEAVSGWVDNLRALWDGSFAALETEIARGRRDRATAPGEDAP